MRKDETYLKTCFYRLRKQSNNKDKNTDICYAAIAYLYSIKKLSERRVCEQLNIPGVVIQYALKYYNIEKRTRSQAAKNRPEGCNEANIKAMNKRNSELLSNKDSDWYKTRSNKISVGIKAYLETESEEHKKVRLTKMVETKRKNGNLVRSIESVQKGIETRKKNGSLNTSQGEEMFYQLLLTLFEKEDIIREYKEERYPFRCDFYIKSLDLFIEYQGHFTHGDKPFSKDDNECLIEETRIKSKIEELDSAMYTTYLNIWTIRDPQKLQAIIDNNLNAVLIYPLKNYEVLAIECFDGKTNYIKCSRENYYRRWC